MPTSLAVLCSMLLLTAYLPLGSLGLLLFACVLPGIWLLWFFDFRRRRQPNRKTTEPSVTTLGMEPALRPSIANPVAYPLGASQIPVTPCASIAEAFGTPVITFKANTPSTQLPAPIAAPVTPAREQAIAWPPSQPPAPSLNPKAHQRPSKPTAEHFMRHSGLPGFLYLARNDQHIDDLYKVGYTTREPDARVAMLNEELSNAGDIGSFRLVHTARASAALEAEQASFQVLERFRVADGREYFLAPEYVLRATLDALAAHIDGRSHLFHELVADVGILRTAAPKTRPLRDPATVPPLSTGGAVYLARNPFHRENIYRLGHTVGNLTDALDHRNRAQRRLTSQLGFFDLVHVSATPDPAAVVSALLPTIHQHRVHPRLRFYRASRTSLVDRIERAVSQASDRAVLQADQSVVSRPRGEVTQRGPNPMPRPSSPTWHGRPASGESAFTNTCPHSHCENTVRAAGARGLVGVLRCGACRRPVGFEIGSGLLTVWRDNA